MDEKTVKIGDFDYIISKIPFIHDGKYLLGIFLKYKNVFTNDIDTDKEINKILMKYCKIKIDDKLIQLEEKNYPKNIKDGMELQSEIWLHTFDFLVD